MARQGHRVWAARLVTLAILLAVTSISAYWVWRSIALGPSGTLVQAPEVPKVPVENDATAVPHELDPLLDFARKALQNHIEKHQDYTAVLVKRENVGGKLTPECKMALKLMYGVVTDEAGPSRPVSAYLKSLEPKSQAGREVIWVQGRNDGKITAHEAGLLGMVSVDLMPESRLAMIGNRYPITEIGIEKLLRKLIERGERDRQMGPASVRTVENAEIDGRKCRLMEIEHDSPTAVVDGKTVQFEFNLAQIYIDEEQLIPLKYASFGWPKKPNGPAELLEEYSYLDLKFNVGLTEKDFDSTNPAYRF
ncbi:MAG: DUF1571 domain-containing protein [Planctomycetota bacterium]|nr:DUF1571 domain-containing protein [Planctomycetota bacterium]